MYKEGDKISGYYNNLNIFIQGYINSGWGQHQTKYGGAKRPKTIKQAGARTDKIYGDHIQYNYQ